MKNDLQEFGKAFKDLRQLAKTSRSDLKMAIPETSLRKFESGMLDLGFKKVVSGLNFMKIKLSDFQYFAHLSPVEPQFGRTFRKIRRQRGYRKDFFINVGVDELELELFEDEKIMLPYNVLNAMLMSIHVPEADFAYYINGEAEDYFVQLVDKLDWACWKNDKNFAQEVEREAGKYSVLLEKKKVIADDDENHDYTSDRLTRQYMDYRVLELTAKGAYSILKEQEVTEIGDFLFGIDIWTEYGLGILAINARQLPYLLVHSILVDMLNEDKRYKDRLIYRRRVVQIAVRCGLTLAKNGAVKEARNLLDLVEAFNFSIDTLVQGMYQFALAYVDYCAGNREVGKQKMLTVITAFELFKEKEGYDYALAFYQKNMK